MQPDSSNTLAVIAILLGVYVLAQFLRAPTHKLRHIPTIGSSNILFSYLDAIRYFRHGQDMIQEGYNNFYGKAFKVPTLERWLTVVSGEEMIEDFRRASKDDLSFYDALSENFQSDYTIGRQIFTDPYHSTIVQTTLTRNLPIRFADIKDEISASFNDLVADKGDEWTSLPALSTMTEIVCRTSNRLFVGLPLCRNSDYIKLNQQFTIDVVAGVHLINMFPSFLKPVVGRFLANIPANMKRAMVHLGPLIHRQLEQGHDDYNEKPNDLISWLLEEARGPQRTPRELVNRILAINFASIHTSSNALTNALFYLAANPEYVEPMREEVEVLIGNEGWTKMTIDRMRKVDSFLRESLRLSASAANIRRKVVNTFTFSNGVTLPAGTHVALAVSPTHMDPEFYEDPHQFKGFRFANMRESEGQSNKNQLVSLSQDYLIFGTGRHACPGRFFVANELKTILAHILLTYDIRLFDDGARPENQWFMGINSPNRTVEIMFRKRKA